ncbi:TetR family transcriptional regulator [Streptomyces sp. 4N509B]|uniref:TetR family transcriptional regulator n=1 Tax=Streptomyces sp. 4N509B TaxID=3457413 RepID=UPI003FD3B61E
MDSLPSPCPDPVLATDAGASHTGPVHSNTARYQRESFDTRHPTAYTYLTLQYRRPVLGPTFGREWATLRQEEEPTVQERARRTQATVLLAAAEEFASHGYAGARLDRVAARTGMTKGALYAHFSSKDALAHRLVGWVEEAWETVVAESRADAASVAALRTLVIGLARRVIRDVHVRAGLRLLREAPRHWRPGYDLVDGIHDTVARVAEQAQSRGEISSRYSVRAITRLLLTVVWVAANDETSEQILEELWHMAESALVRNPVRCL